MATTYNSMELYRIVSEKYAHSLLASGAPNRWNIKNEYVIYSGSSRSLATLELIVHRNFIQPKVKYKVLVITLSDDKKLIRKITPKELPKNWRQFSAYAALQQKGSQWYKSKQSLVLKVPSAVIPKEYNYILNTEHQDFKNNVQIKTSENYFWDERLL